MDSKPSSIYTIVFEKCSATCLRYRQSFQKWATVTYRVLLSIYRVQSANNTLLCKREQHQLNVEAILTPKFKILLRFTPWFLLLHNKIP